MYCCVGFLDAHKTYMLIFCGIKTSKQSYLYRDIHLKKSYENHSIKEKWVNAHIHILLFAIDTPQKYELSSIESIIVMPTLL